MLKRLFSNRKKNVSLGILNMPIDLVLVRHGAAEGNRAFNESRKGNNALFTNQFMERHESKWRLTSEGMEQAKITGQWIQKNISSFFGTYLTSEFVRALETAALMNFPNAHWEKNGFLQERNFGRLSSLTYEERERRFSRELEMRKRDAFYWMPPSGESLADVSLRVDYIIGSLEHAFLRPSSAIIVTHFNVMQVFRTRIERIRQSQFVQKLINVPEELKIKNGSVIHYTRKNPYNGKIDATYTWRRIITPWRTDIETGQWEKIEYGYLSNEAILKELDETNQRTIAKCE